MSFARYAHRTDPVVSRGECVSRALHCSLDNTAYLSLTKERLDQIERREFHSIVLVEQCIDEQQPNIDKQVRSEEKQLQMGRLFLHEFDQQTNHLNRAP